MSSTSVKASPTKASPPTTPNPEQEITELKDRFSNMERTLTAVSETLAKLALQEPKVPLNAPRQPRKPLSDNSVPLPLRLDDLSDDEWNSDDEENVTAVRQPLAGIPRIQVEMDPRAKSLRSNLNAARHATANVKVPDHLIWPSTKGAKFNADDKILLNTLRISFNNAKGVIQANDLALRSEKAEDIDAAIDLANVFALDTMRVVLEFRTRLFLRRTTNDDVLKMYEALALNQFGPTDREALIQAMQITSEKRRLNTPVRNPNPGKQNSRGNPFRRGGRGNRGKKQEVGAEDGTESQ